MENISLWYGYAVEVLQCSDGVSVFQCFNSSSVYLGLTLYYSLDNCPGENAAGFSCFLCNTV